MITGSLKRYGIGKLLSTLQKISNDHRRIQVRVRFERLNPLAAVEDNLSRRKIVLQYYTKACKAKY